MSRAEFYRAEASRCHASAMTCREPEAARRWREIAQGYQDVADRFDGMNRLVRGESAAYREPTSTLQG